jgi:hypothetical protein
MRKTAILSTPMWGRTSATVNRIIVDLFALILLKVIVPSFYQNMRKVVHQRYKSG